MTVISTPVEYLNSGHIKSIYIGYNGKTLVAYDKEKGILNDELLNYVIEDSERQTTDIIALAGGCYGRCLE